MIIKFNTNTKEIVTDTPCIFNKLLIAKYYIKEVIAPIIIILIY